MTADEHPEHLLDHALAGNLDAAERAALALHLAACSACALHLALATQPGSGTPAAARDEALNRLAIAGALARRPGPARESAWRIGGRSLRLAAASVLLVAGLAAAAVSLRRAHTPRAAVETTPGGTPSAKPRASGRPVPATTSEAPAPAPAPASARRSERTTNIVPSAAVLFGRASDLRRQGRVDQAIDTYRVLQQRYPGTREAKVSYALAGRLLLERDRPAQALTALDRYLEIDAEVAEEALAGRAEALRRLNRPRPEAAAWRLLLARFPESVYSEQARLRLTALGSASSSPPGPGAPGRR